MSVKMNKVFTNYDDLKIYIGADGIYSTYAEDELSNYLGCVGSNIGSFKLEIDDKKYEITVSSKENENGNFMYKYIVEELN